MHRLSHSDDTHTGKGHEGGEKGRKGPLVVQTGAAGDTRRRAKGGASRCVQESANNVCVRESQGNDDVLTRTHVFPADHFLGVV